jgi:hypothetical protein
MEFVVEKESASEFVHTQLAVQRGFVGDEDERWLVGAQVFRRDGSTRMESHHVT